ncbi:hypothetical protein Q3G72_025788 [Acer saccharum]|nr:hypothetical protein Q3G72_025788 [Acer saccharum]
MRRNVSVNYMETPLIFLICLACFFSIAAQARTLSSESWDNKIYMIIEYGNGRALSPPPPPKPASPTQQIITSCDSENNQCIQLVFIKSDHKRKNSPPPPPPPKSSPSPHEVTRPAPPPPKLPSSSPWPGIKMLQVL